MPVEDCSTVPTTVRRTYLAEKRRGRRETWCWEVADQWSWSRCCVRSVTACCLAVCLLGSTICLALCPSVCLCWFISMTSGPGRAAAPCHAPARRWVYPGAHCAQLTHSLCREPSQCRTGGMPNTGVNRNESSGTFRVIGVSLHFSCTFSKVFKI